MLAEPDLVPHEHQSKDQQRVLTGWTAEQGQSWDRKETEARKKRKEDLSGPAVAASGPRQEEDGRLRRGDSTVGTGRKCCRREQLRRAETEDALHLSGITLPRVRRG